jgi:alpha-1,2-mannosyltransferase
MVTGVAVKRPDVASRAVSQPLWLMSATLLALAVTLQVYVRMTLTWPQSEWQMIDPQVYHAGGQAVAAGNPLYAQGLVGPLVFAYPPAAALLFLLLAPFSMEVLKPLMVAGNVLALIATIWLAFGLVGHRRGPGRLAIAVLVAAFVFWLEPVRTTLVLGQVNLFLLLLIMLDLAQSERWPWKGVGVGIATGIKLTPAFFWSTCC